MEKKYLKRKPMVRKVSGIAKASKRPAKKKKTKVALWAEYGLKKPVYVRYSGLAGVLWWVMSQYVRQTEFKEFGGECVDGCGRKVLDWREADCGHFISATKLKTRFMRKNLGLQTKFCNSPFMGNDNTYGYGKMINKRYGEGTAEELIELSKETGKAMTKSEMHEQILYFQALLEKE